MMILYVLVAFLFGYMLTILVRDWWWNYTHPFVMPPHDDRMFPHQVNQLMLSVRENRGSILVVKHPTEWDKSPSRPYALDGYAYTFYCKSEADVDLVRKVYDAPATEFCMSLINDPNGYCYKYSITYMQGQ